MAMVIGCFGGIIGLLISLDGGPVPDWGAGFTVNAVLSIIVTVMKGAIGIVIAECLSQLKWSWFKRSRRLIDLVIWDEASRGAWGARRLLMTARTWYLGYIGALTVLAAFIIGPSIQQTVEVVVRQVELPSNATMPVCNSSYYQNVGLGGGAGLNKVDLTMLGEFSSWTIGAMISLTPREHIQRFCTNNDLIRLAAKLSKRQLYIWDVPKSRPLHRML